MLGDGARIARRRVNGESIERGLARGHPVLRAPFQEGFEPDGYETRVLAADRQAHECAVPPVDPVVVASVSRQLAHEPARKFEIRSRKKRYRNVGHDKPAELLVKLMDRPFCFVSTF